MGGWKDDLRADWQTIKEIPGDVLDWWRGVYAESQVKGLVFAGLGLAGALFVFSEIYGVFAG